MKAGKKTTGYLVVPFGCKGACPFIANLRFLKSGQIKFTRMDSRFKAFVEQITM